MVLSLIRGQALVRAIRHLTMECNVITTQDTLVQTRTIVSAVERALDQAMTQARHLTQGGQASTTTRCTVNGWPIERRSCRLPRHCCATRCKVSIDRMTA